jgi:hypothetical protein
MNLADRMDDFQWIKVEDGVDFIKAGDGLWVSRNNAYTIIKDGRAQYRVSDGYGNKMGVATSLKKAKALADEHANGR